MKLNLETLNESGGFVGRPVARQVTWRQGDDEYTADVWVRPLSYNSAVSDLLAVRDETDPVAGRIAASIVDEDGNPVFTVADIIGTADPERGPLNSALTMALLALISEVNGLGKKPS